jgi:neutral ceramidase
MFMFPLKPILYAAVAIITFGSRLTAAVPADRVFRAGAATSNITPPLGASLDGYIAQGTRATRVHDDVHARCLVLDDGRTRIALVVVDNTMIAREIHERAKQLVPAASGLAPDRILIAATHTHSTPRAVPLHGDAAEREYQEFLARRIADGIQRAVSNLAPARVGWGSVDRPEFVFSRRWHIKPEARVPNPFGETGDQVLMNPGPARSGLVAPASQPDPELFILSVQHADGRPLAVLANYGLHYVGGTGAGAISADYFGAFADRLAARLAAPLQDPPFVGLMANGTSGDINNVDYGRPAGPPAPPYVRINEVAGRLAEAAEQVYRKIKHEPWVPLAMAESELPLAVRRPSPERLAWAKKVWLEVKDRSKLTRREVYARETLAVVELPNRVPLKLQAIRIGGLGIAAAPCEVFASTGLEIKARSALRPAFTISLANGYNGYLPTPRDHALGGYETWLARSSYLEVEASEKIRDELLRLMSLVAAVSP